MIGFGCLSALFPFWGMCGGCSLESPRRGDSDGCTRRMFLCGGGDEGGYPLSPGALRICSTALALH